MSTVAKRAASLRVATWNVEHASASRKTHGKAVREVMRDTAADVWVLTESDPDFAPGDDYRLLARSAEPDDIRTGRAWVTIWANNDVWASHACELRADPSRTAAAFVRLGDRIPILVYGTVLPWRSDSLWPGALGERFSRALAAQAAEWDALRCQDDAELCVAGDFNQELSGPIRVGSVAGREALRRVLKDQDLNCPTTEPHDPIGAIRGRGSIDHILISAGLRAVGSDGQPQVTVIPPTVPLPRNLSDHYGVCVELTPMDPTTSREQ